MGDIKWVGRAGLYRHVAQEMAAACTYPCALRRSANAGIHKNQHTFHMRTPLMISPWQQMRFQAFRW